MEIELNSKTTHAQQDTYVRDAVASNLTEAEQQLLMQWNATQTPFPTEKCIHQLFEDQVERSPEAVAVPLRG